MAPVRAILVIAAIAAAVEAAAPTEDAPACARTAASLMRVLEMAQFQKEPEGTVRSVFDDATVAEVRCARSESVTYVRLRSAELGKGSFVGDLTPAARAEWQRLADRAAVRFPRSARILTESARATGSVEIAMRAVAADGTYVPAKVALASALIGAGEAARAARMLDGLAGLEATSDGFAVLARARLATNDFVGASRAAKQQLRHRQVELIEPDVGNPWPLIEAHEVAAFAALGLGQYDEAARHLVAANFGSAKVRDLIDHPPPALRRALRKIGPGRAP
jgi:hypothetical protein